VKANRSRHGKKAAAKSFRISYGSNMNMAETTTKRNEKSQIVRPRRSGKLIVFVLIISIGFGMMYFLHLRIYESRMMKIRADMTQMRYRDALKEIDRLGMIPFTGTDELNYFRGELLLMTAKAEEAMESWEDVRETSGYYAKSILKLTEWLETEGRLGESELKYREALAKKPLNAIDIRHGLIQLLWLEGRLAEASELIEENWMANFKDKGVLDGATLSNLRAHLSIEFEVYPVDHVRKRLLSIYEKRPEDPGVRLALVNLLFRNGEFKEAEAIYQSIQSAPFPEIRNAIDFSGLLIQLKQRDFALSDQVRFKDLEIDLPSAIRLVAEIQNKMKPNQEMNAFLEEAYRLFPANPELIEALTLRSLNQSDRNEAEKLRRRRENLDQIRRDYGNLVGSDLRRDPAKMADMAEKLGRWFEAFAFRSMTNQTKQTQTNSQSLTNQQILDSADASRKRISFSNVLRMFDIKSADVAANQGRDKADHVLLIPKFEDITASSGISFQFESGRTEKRQLPETMSGGLAMIDYDNDGIQDLFLLQGGEFPHASKMANGDRLFRNLGDGQFADVTAAAGFPDQSTGYSHGVAVGDVNNDSYNDLFITRFGEYQLWINTGKGKFQDKT
jgi:tetratricopeptide (TPR) repeat protein